MAQKSPSRVPRRWGWRLKNHSGMERGSFRYRYTPMPKRFARRIRSFSVLSRFSQPALSSGAKGNSTS